MIHCTRTSDIYHPFALLHSLNYFHFCFHCHFLVLLSSTSCITASFIFASGHPGLQIKVLYYWTLSSTVQYAKAQPLVEDVCTWQCTPDMLTNLYDCTSKSTCASLKACNLKVLMWGTYCTFFHPLTFSLYVSLGLKWVSCRHSIYRTCFLSSQPVFIFWLEHLICFLMHLW